MKVFLLQPNITVDNSFAWRRSSRRERCIVCAATELEARLLADQAFTEDYDIEEADGRGIEVWSDPDLVQCVEIEHMMAGVQAGSIYSVDGVLLRSDARD
jgi:hypothetical protein